MTRDPTEPGSDAQPGPGPSSEPDLDSGLEQNATDVWEFNTHSFVVRIWLEESATEAEPAIWRGYITHVLTGRHHSLQTLKEITDFVGFYLREMGVAT